MNIESIKISVNQKIQEIDKRVLGYDEDIKKINGHKKNLAKERLELEATLEQLSQLK